jgi:hypothetical protein
MGYAGLPSSTLSNTLLIDGVGQAKDGRGHDAFDGYPYERLDQIRMRKVTLGRDHAEIVADITGAYRPELGVEKLERRFTWSRGAWTTTDTLRASKPVVLTAQVHGDNAIRQVAERRFIVEGQPASLQVTTGAGSKAIIEPGIVTAAGPPGNVDKGPKEQRGTVLRISLPAAKQASLTTTMRF